MTMDILILPYNGIDTSSGKDYPVLDPVEGKITLRYVLGLSMYVYYD